MSNAPDIFICGECNVSYDSFTAAVKCVCLNFDDRILTDRDFFDGYE